MNDPNLEEAATLEEAGMGTLPDPGESQEFGMGDAMPEGGLSTMVQQAPPRMDTIMRIPVTVRVVLGSATMPVASLMKLGRGSVIPLERRVGEPVEVAVNGHTVAKGQVVVMDEATSRFGIKLTEVLTQSPISDVAS